MEDTKDYEEMPLMARIKFKDDSTIIWDEYSGLTPDDSERAVQAVSEIKTFIDKMKEVYIDNYGLSSIPITPEGPFAKPSDTDPVIVAWTLKTLYDTEYEVSGDLPTMKDLGLDYNSNFDEDGNPIVR